MQKEHVSNFLHFLFDENWLSVWPLLQIISDYCATKVRIFARLVNGKHILIHWDAHVGIQNKSYVHCDDDENGLTVNDQCYVFDDKITFFQAHNSRNENFGWCWYDREAGISAMQNVICAPYPCKVVHQNKLYILHTDKFKHDMTAYTSWKLHTTDHRKIYMRPDPAQYETNNIQFPHNVLYHSPTCMASLDDWIYVATWATSATWATDFGDNCFSLVRFSTIHQTTEMLPKTKTLLKEVTHMIVFNKTENKKNDVKHINILTRDTDNPQVITLSDFQSKTSTSITTKSDQFDWAFVDDKLYIFYTKCGTVDEISISDGLLYLSETKPHSIIPQTSYGHVQYKSILVVK